MGEMEYASAVRIHLGPTIQKGKTFEKAFALVYRTARTRQFDEMLARPLSPSEQKDVLCDLLGQVGYLRPLLLQTALKGYH